MKYKRTITLTIFLLLTFYAQAQIQSPLETVLDPYWLSFEKGKKYFREGDYGNALIAFEDARNDRNAMFTQFEQDWILLLSLGEVRRMNDSLDRIETYVRERGQFAAEKSLDDLYWRVKKESLRNSALTALSIFRQLKYFPEAEYWIGEVFRIEGESEVALEQYRMAIEHSANLEVPGFLVEIQYRVAEIENERQHYNRMEAQLNEILEDDELWQQDDGSFVKTAMARTLENESIDKFLSMYRYRNAVTERAHRILGHYYYLSGRHNKALDHLMFAFMITTTTIIDECIEEQFDFRFTNLENLMNQIVRRSDIKNYIAETDYFKTIYYFACALYATGRTRTARELWSFLRSQQNAGEWSGRAANQLRAPFVEKAVEMP
ncbi:hypothetical protein AGMMS50212_01570 [Spirochaetia bacterium]|nr:hypothetical protein AGMMS50212_01570 [Spirochaetia bacterium]